MATLEEKVGVSFFGSGWGMIIGVLLVLFTIVTGVLNSELSEIGGEGILWVVAVYFSLLPDTGFSSDIGDIARGLREDTGGV